MVFFSALGVTAAGSLIGAAFVSEAYWRHVLIETGVGVGLFLAVETFLMRRLARWLYVVLVLVGALLVVTAKFIHHHGAYWELLLISLGVAIVLFVALEVFAKRSFRGMIKLLTTRPPLLGFNFEKYHVEEWIRRDMFEGLADIKAAAEGQPIEDEEEREEVYQLLSSIGELASELQQGALERLVALLQDLAAGVHTAVELSKGDRLKALRLVRALLEDLRLDGPGWPNASSKIVATTLGELVDRSPGLGETWQHIRHAMEPAEPSRGGARSTKPSQHGGHL